MKYNKQEIKEGINLHTIQTNKFKTNLLSIFITTPLERESITKNAIISSVLRRGTMKMPTLEAISKQLEQMYGASFDCGIDKIGDNHVMKFYLESVNDEFIPQENEILKKAIDTLLEIVLNPLVENNQFKQEYVEAEKQNIKQIIEGKKDNKSKYALDRCIEEMYKDKPYGLYKYGYVEDLENINSKQLYDYYKEMLQKCKIDIFVSGKIEEKNVKQIILQNSNIEKLQSRATNINENKLSDKKQEINTVKEEMNITQGKLVIGLNVEKCDTEDKYTALVYNMILGGGANSKLFQNVREKANLAYVASSNYIRQKDNIFIRCGIEIKNYEKAVEIIKQQLQDIKDGNFSDKDLEDAKLMITSAIKFIPDEQDTQITYYFGQEISNNNTSFEEYENKVKSITKQQIVELSKNININTIYFLTAKEN